MKDEIDRLREQRAQDIRRGASPEAWDRSLVGQQLALLEATHSLGLTIKSTVYDSSLGRWWRNRFGVK